MNAVRLTQTVAGHKVRIVQGRTHDVRVVVQSSASAPNATGLRQRVAADRGHRYDYCAAAEAMRSHVIIGVSERA